MDKLDKVNLDWKNLGFSYIKTDYRFFAKYKDGCWDNGELSTDNQITMSEAATVLHYGQECFEGLKAFETKDGDIVIFRPQENAKRINESAKRLMMPQIPEDLFLDAVKKVVFANKSWVPPYGSGGSLYIRPYHIATGENISVKPADEYLFGVFCMPVGPYYKDGFMPVDFLISDYDRAAPNGTGHIKAGGNYAAGMVAGKDANDRGFSGCLYLDSRERRYIDEAGAANFFAITKDDVFVTPKSDSILPSITKNSLLTIAKEDLGIEVCEREIDVCELEDFVEAGACGTAVVITPIGKISYNGKMIEYGSCAGPISTRLYERLIQIQYGEVEDKRGWLLRID